MNGKRLLLLNASPRRTGTSVSFAKTIKSIAETQGQTVEIEHIIDYFDGRRDLEELNGSLRLADVIGVISPLYVDTLPYPAIWLLERLSQGMRQELRGKSFFVLGQSGFPDPAVCQPLLNAGRFFAEETGMKWLGGLAYGGGAIIDGAPLNELGKKGKRITRALRLALEDLSAIRPIRGEAQEVLEERIPKILYRPLAAFLNYRTWATARRLGVRDVCSKVYFE